MITAAQIKLIMPDVGNRADKHIDFMNAAMETAAINTPLRAACFIAQIAHESSQLRFMQELASGLAYEGRTDLGNTQPGDGRRFKGRGPIQVTGRDNYETFSKWAGLPAVMEHPEMLEEPRYGWLASAWFWQYKHLNELADIPDFLRISIRINGLNRETKMPNGWGDRLQFFAKARKVLGC
jgi:putative chitinase